MTLQGTGSLLNEEFFLLFIVSIIIINPVSCYKSFLLLIN